MDVTVVNCCYCFEKGCFPKKNMVVAIANGKYRLAIGRDNARLVMTYCVKIEF
jgi:hypothetical protein